VTGKSLPGAVRSLIPFDELGLDDTYWEILEDTPPDAADRAHQYFGDSIDNAELDASQDLYGGGGLVSTTADLARFYEGLFGGKVFEKPSTLKTMTKISGPGREDLLCAPRLLGHPDDPLPPPRPHVRPDHQPGRRRELRLRRPRAGDRGRNRQVAGARPARTWPFGHSPWSNGFVGKCPPARRQRRR
jgi:hypothetical protein